MDEEETKQIKPLPNLDYKIVAGNSLLGFPFKSKGLEEIEKLKTRFFEEIDHDNKEKLKEHIQLALSECLAGSKRSLGYQVDFDFEIYFSEVFHRKGGFDVTIGNPPYVRADAAGYAELRKAILESSQYETLWEKWDLFVPFIEKAYKLLRPGGVTTMIVSDAFCHSKYAQKPQKWFLANASVLCLDFCTDLQIFDAAVHNVIYFFQKASGAQHVPVRRVHRQQFGQVTFLPSEEQFKLTYRAFFPEVGGLSFSAPTLTLTSLCYISYGIAASSDEKLYKGEFVTEDVVQDFKDATHPKRYIEGKDIQGWFTPFHRFLEWGTKRAPHKFRRQTFIELHEAKEKLMTIVVTGGKPPVMFDDLQRFTTHTSCIFIPWHSLHGVRNKSLMKAARYQGEKPPRPDLPKREELEETSRHFSVKYLLGVMNSAVARDFLRSNRRSNIHLYPDDWKKLPIPDIPPERQKAIVKLVDRILAAKARDAAADVSALEREIDQLVYALYGLTPEEIKLIEDSTQR